MGPVRIRHSIQEIATQSSHSVDRAGWQAKMASIELWIPSCNADGPHQKESGSEKKKKKKETVCVSGSFSS